MRVEKVGVKNECLVVRIRGKLDTEKFISMYDEISSAAGKSGAKGVIFDARKLNGAPGVYEIYRLISRMSCFTKKGLKVASVYGRGRNDEGDFADNVASNRCILYGSFENLREAKQWIISERAN